MIILASASPRRKELLSLITRDFKVLTSDVDEGKITAKTPRLLAQGLAKAKCAAVAAAHKDDVVIGCDTVVEIGGEILGKPKNEADAARMISLLSGKTHLVHTGVCIAHKGTLVTFAETTKVYFSNIPKAAIDAYVKTLEPYDKAGAYGIQGWAAKYTRKINGCYYNVMGLPVSRLMSTLITLNVKP